MALVYPEDVLKQVEFETISDGWKKWRCWQGEHVKWAARKFRALVKSFGRRWELERVEMGRNNTEDGKGRDRVGPLTVPPTEQLSPEVLLQRRSHPFGIIISGVGVPQSIRASRGSPCPLIFKDHLATQ